MTNINTLKLQEYNIRRKDTARQVANLLSQLKNILLKALNEQSYARKDPDSIIDEEYLIAIGAEFASLKIAFSSIQDIVIDMDNVRNDIMAVDELITKYSINLPEFSNSLL